MATEKDFIGSVDGISAPVQSSAGTVPSPVPPPQQSMHKKARGGKTLVVVLLTLAVLYTLPMFVLITLFPTRDGSLAELRSIATLMYGVGTLAWLGFGMLGFLRISSLKDRPKAQLRGLFRLLILVVPMAAVGCVVVVLINREPRLNLDILSPQSTQEFVAPLTVEFGTMTASKIFAQQSLTPLKYMWDFNADGAVEQETFEPQATYVYSRQGIYSIAVHVVMTNGVQKKLSGRIVIPKDSFSVEPAAPLIDEAVKFSIAHLILKKEDIKNVQWDFDSDGTADTTSTSLDASYTYHALGPVTATATIFYSNQTQTKLSRSLNVMLPPAPPFPITLETDPATLLGPPPFPVTFTIKTSEPIANVSWNFGDDATSEGLLASHSYKTVGTFTATALVRSQSGSTVKLTKVVRVPEPLVLGDLSFEGKPAVQGNTITGEVPLTIDITPVTSQPLVSFSWDAPGASNIASSDRRLNVTYLKEGKYNIELIGFDADNKVMRKRISVTVLPASAVVSFIMDPSAPEAPAEVKFDASDTFIPSSEEVTGFEWDFGDRSNTSGSIFSGTRISHTFQNPGKYVISVRVKTTSGGEYTGTKTLVVRAPNIRACFLASRTSVKAGSAVSFDPSCSTGQFETWYWNFGDGSESDLRNPLPHVYESSGNYNVVLTVTTKDDRKSTHETTISVSQ